MKNTEFRFRCIPNPKVVYMPADMNDVEGMRFHPEYEEIDAEGNVLARPAFQQQAYRAPRVEPRPAKKGRK
jgi:hypothetical protein